MQFCKNAAPAGAKRVWVRRMEKWTISGAEISANCRQPPTLDTQPEMFVACAMQPLNDTLHQSKPKSSAAMRETNDEISQLASGRKVEAAASRIVQRAGCAC